MSLTHHDHHHHHESEAQAVVAEAEALERETREETARLQRYIKGAADDADDPQAQYDRLRDAAATVARISFEMQDPAREDPYADLGREILPQAQAMLKDIQAFTPPDNTTAKAAPAHKS